ncbi:unnamed protein product [Gulo gulo]|uniref:Uncharacterized protein n=1 Tax=Gulo gulo TaxID=48420 RepID=A0A9X9LX42_GULGU|nr:unnamed protein product [Gulo gulo]
MAVVWMLASALKKPDVSQAFLSLDLTNFGLNQERSTCTPEE